MSGSIEHPHSVSQQSFNLSLNRRWNVFRRIFAGLGIPGALKHLWHHSLGFGGKQEYLIQPRGIDHALVVRRSTSDVDAFKLIFVDREYASLDNLLDVRLVVDCGANVGYSSAYFLSVFPQCEVIAVEPDANNFAVLSRNLAPYGDRAKCMRAGVWSQSAPLAIAAEPYGDGREWSRQVRLCGPNDSADFEGIDVETLLAGSNHARISLLKVDIEGAEAVIFAENYQSWLDKVDTIAIELHDDSSFGNGSEVFHAAIRGRNFRVSQHGELTICRTR